MAFKSWSTTEPQQDGQTDKQTDRQTDRWGWAYHHASFMHP